MESALVMASRAGSSTLITGPPANSAVSCHAAPGAYTAMWSQTMLFLSRSPIDFETSRCLSQYCATRPSEIRLSAAVDGAPQSVGSTGSHTTKACTGLPGNSFNTSSIAEAPCKQTVQVGDSSTSTRTSPLESLKAFSMLERVCDVRSTSAGCVGGAVWPP